jgi:hypothetical protein
VYVSPDSALARARLELREFNDVFDPGVLPGSIELHLRAGFRDPRTVARLAERLRAYPGVEEVRYGEEWVQKLYRLRNLAAIVGAALGAAFAAVAVVIIGSTIRMAVLARAREIAIMRLVGATPGFVRRPFLIEGFVKGALGGAVALALTYAAAALVTRYFVETHFFTPRQAALGVAAGALLGVLRLLGGTASLSRLDLRLAFRAATGPTGLPGAVAVVLLLQALPILLVILLAGPALARSHPHRIGDVAAGLALALLGQGAVAALAIAFSTWGALAVGLLVRLAGETTFLVLGGALVAWAVKGRVQGGLGG